MSRSTAKTFVLAALLCTALQGGLCPSGFAAEPSRLVLENLPDRRVRIVWTNIAQRIVLEETSTLTNPVPWLPSSEPVILDGNVFSSVLSFGGTTRFFRLKDVGPLFTTFSSSPASGETGVAVTREMILTFNQPLAATTVLTSSNLYAEFGGRRILSRIELSSDRRKATLFYLEDLPASARVRVTFDAFNVADDFGVLVDADRDEIAGGARVIEFDTRGITPLSGTAVIGRVFASQLTPNPTNASQSANLPLQGVVITVDGAEETLRTTTDANGFFRLAPAPAGRFFVHVDGRIAVGSTWPNGDYYPTVGKAWEAVAGKTNNLAAGTGEIFLPLIKAGTLQPVSATTDTTITFPPNVISNNPALAGVHIIVPANALFSDSGVRGGKVGIAPVPPDRLPEPLPPGLEFPLVITVQTDGGLNFDRPAPVCFPNLPDPVLKTPLPAGSKQALFSFNHDKGIWEAVGSMTVTLDGRFVISDPGTGIRQPGWHAAGPQPFNPDPCESQCCEFAGGGAPAGPSPSASSFAMSKATGLECCDLPYPTAGACLNACEKNAGARKRRCDTELAECIEGVVIPIIGDYFCASEYRECLESVKEARDSCVAHCVQGQAAGCFHTEAPLPGKIGFLRHLFQAKGSPIEDTITTKLEQIADLLVAFGPGPLTPQEEAQIQALKDEADAAAGGSAETFLRELILAAEDQSLRDGSLFSQGNAPRYPVLYKATIYRGTNLMELRGLTGP